MQRHDVNYFSLVSGLLFGAVAVMLLVTDGRFSGPTVPWAALGILLAAVAGIAIVASATSSLVRERRGTLAPQGDDDGAH